VQILYISYDGMTDPLGQSQVIPYLQGLSERGVKFTLISFEKPDRFSVAGEQIKAILKKSNIQWHPLTYHKAPPVISTLYDLWQLKHRAKKLYKKNGFNIVHCRSYIASLIGLYLKKRHNIKFIFDMRGFWADERVEGGMWNLKKMVFRAIYAYFKRKEKEFLQQADFTISLTENAKNFIFTQKLDNLAPIQVIPCCADLSLFCRDHIKEEKIFYYRNKLGLNESDFVLLYLGSLGTWYKLDEMLRFFKTLLAYKSQSKFLILTKEPIENIQKEVNKLNIPSEKVIVTAVERQEVPIYIGLTHCAIFFYKPTFSRKATSPTKQGEIMGMGVPVICNKGVGDTDEIIQKTSSGVVIADFSQSNYQEVCENLDSLTLMNPENIRKGAEKYYSLESGIKLYEKVYMEVGKSI